MQEIETTIFGSKYVLKGDLPEEYMRETVNLVNKEIENIKSKFPDINDFKTAILVSLNLADTLQKLQKQSEEIAQNIKSIEEQTNSIISLLD